MKSPHPEEKQPIVSKTIQIQQVYAPLALWNVAQHLEKRNNLHFVRADLLRCQLQAKGGKTWLEEGGLEIALKHLGIQSSAPESHATLLAASQQHAKRRFRRLLHASYVLIALLIFSLWHNVGPQTPFLNHHTFTAATLLLNGLLLGFSIGPLTQILRIEIRCRLQDHIPLPGTIGYQLLALAGIFGGYYLYWHTPLPFYVETVGVLCWWLALADYLTVRRRYLLLSALKADGFDDPGALTESAVLAERDPLGPLQINYTLARQGAPLAVWLGLLALIWWWSYPAAFAELRHWGQPYLPTDPALPAWGLGWWMALGIWMMGCVMPNIGLLVPAITELIQHRALDFHVRLPSDCHIPLLFKTRMLCFFRHRVFTSPQTHCADYVGLDGVAALDALSWARAITATAPNVQGEDRDIQAALEAAAARERAPVRALEAWSHEPGLACVAHNEEEGFMLARGSYLEQLGISLQAVKHPRYVHQQEAKTILYLARGGRWDPYNEELRHITHMTVFGYVTFTHEIHKAALPTMRVLKRLQVETRLLSPDDAERAKILAQQVGVSAYQGKQLPADVERTMKQYERNTVGALGLVTHATEAPQNELPTDITLLVESNDTPAASHATPPNAAASNTASHTQAHPVRITAGGIENLAPVLLLIRSGQFAALRGLVIFLLSCLGGMTAGFLGLLHPALILGWGLLAEGLLFLHTRAIHRFNYERSLQDLMSS